MYKNQTATGLPKDMTPGMLMPLCDDCEQMKARQDRNPPRTDQPRAKLPMEVVAVDWIPLKPKSRRGNTGAFVYADEKTKTLYADPRKSKTQALKSLRHFVNKNVTAYGHRLKRLQADSEAIFATNERYRDWCANKDILQSFSAPYCHYQNRGAERGWGTLKNAGSTTMKSGRIAGDLWDYVLPAVATTINMLPLKTNGYTKSPYELLTGRKPDVSRIVPLGAKAFVRQYDEEPSKSTHTLRPKAHVGRVIGYPEEYKNAYYILTSNNGVLVRRDVVVDHANTDLASPRAARNKQATPEPRQARSTTPSEREPSSRIKSGLVGRPLRHYTDQVSDPLLGNRGKVINQRSYNATALPFCKPGRLPLPPIVGEAPSSLDKAMRGNDPLHVRAWKEAAELELQAFKTYIIPCSREETFGHKIYQMFAKLRLKKDRTLQELIFKVRLVFDGSKQIKGIDYDDSFSPTLSMRCLFIMIHIGTCRGMLSWQADIGNAYLQAAANEVLFVQLPKYYGREYQYARLSGNAYGKTTAGLLWYTTINAHILDSGWTRSMYDICLYYKTGPHGLLLLGLVVDDTLVYCNSELEIKDFLQSLESRFPKVTNCKPLVFTGMELNSYKHWTTVGQTEYIANMLRQHNIVPDKRVMVPMTKDMFDRIQAAPRPDLKTTKCSNHFEQAGQARWLDKTRYDLAFALGVQGQFQNNSLPIDQEGFSKFYQYVANTADRTLRLGGRDHTVKAFFIVDGSKRVSSGIMCQMMFLSTDSGCVQFKSKKSRSVSLSSTQPEMFSILAATKDAIWLRGLLSEIGYHQKEPTAIYTDSGPCIDAIKSISHTAETRYLIPIIDFVRQEVDRRTISIHFIKGSNNPADMGTKAVPGPLLDRYSKVALHGLGMKQYNGYDDFVDPPHTTQYRCPP